MFYTTDGAPRNEVRDADAIDWLQNWIYLKEHDMPAIKKSRSFQEVQQKILNSMTPEQRLAGLEPESIIRALAGLEPESIIRALAGLEPESIIRALTELPASDRKCIVEALTASTERKAG